MPVARPKSARLPATGPEADALRWVRRKLGDVRHERRVLCLADALFGLVGPRLGLADADRRLLRLAAVTHDVGRCVDAADHPRHSAVLIAKTHALDLPPGVRRRLAFLARYHRGAVPVESKQAYLKPADARGPLQAVLAILRTADALDHRRQPAVRVALALIGRHLHVRCVVAGEVAAATRVYTRRKKYRLLEGLLGAGVRVSVAGDTRSLTRPIRRQG